jgi:hypothetical protein
MRPGGRWATSEESTLLPDTVSQVETPRFDVEPLYVNFPVGALVSLRRGAKSGLNGLTQKFAFDSKLKGCLIH